ncbi:MAG TPA: hypothetical protein VHW43_11200 [Puia sp.]|nr:hypothetical protein [Puia sp.]
MTYRRRGVMAVYTIGGEPCLEETIKLKLDRSYFRPAAADV